MREGMGTHSTTTDLSLDIHLEGGSAFFCCCTNREILSQEGSPSAQLDYRNQMCAASTATQRFPSQYLAELEYQGFTVLNNALRADSITRLKAVFAHSRAEEPRAIYIKAASPQQTETFG
jgi:hypothetical protein